MHKKNIFFQNLKENPIKLIVSVLIVFIFSGVTISSMIMIIMDSEKKMDTKKNNIIEIEEETESFAPVEIDFQFSVSKGDEEIISKLEDSLKFLSLEKTYKYSNRSCTKENGCILTACEFDFEKKYEFCEHHSFSTDGLSQSSFQYRNDQYLTIIDLSGTKQISIEDYPSTSDLPSEIFRKIQKFISGKKLKVTQNKTDFHITLDNQNPDNYIDITLGEDGKLMLIGFPTDISREIYEFGSFDDEFSFVNIDTRDMFLIDPNTFLRIDKALCKIENNDYIEYIDATEDNLFDFENKAYEGDVLIKADKNYNTIKYYDPFSNVLLYTSNRNPVSYMGNEIRSYFRGEYPIDLIALFEIDEKKEIIPTSKGEITKYIFEFKPTKIQGEFSRNNKLLPTIEEMSSWMSFHEIPMNFTIEILIDDKENLLEITFPENIENTKDTYKIFADQTIIQNKIIILYYNGFENPLSAPIVMKDD